MITSADFAERFDTQSESWRDLSMNATPFNPNWIDASPLKWMIEESPRINGMPVDFGGACAIAMLAAIATGKVTIHGKSDQQEPACLWVAIACDAGQGKTPVLNRFTNPLFRWQIAKNKQIASKAKQSEARIKALEAEREKARKDKRQEDAIALGTEIEMLRSENKKILRFGGGDVTPESLLTILQEDGGAYTAIDDEASLSKIAAGRYSDIPAHEVYSKAFTGEHISKATKRDGVIQVEHTAFTVLEIVQPAVWTSVMRKLGGDADGFCSRFLVCYPPHVSQIPRLSDPNARIQSTTSLIYERYINELFQFADVTQEVSFSNEALNMVDSCFQREWKEMQSKMGTASGKARGEVVRIAGLLAMANFRKTVYARDAEMAFQIVSWFHQNMGKPQLPEKQAYIISFLAKRKQSAWRCSELAQALTRHTKGQNIFSDPYEKRGGSEMVYFTLRELEAAGYVRIENGTDKNGTPTDDMRKATLAVNPGVFGKQTETFSEYMKTNLPPPPKRPEVSESWNEDEWHAFFDKMFHRTEPHR